jgi:hypothetical protein
MPPINPPKRAQAGDAASVLRFPLETMAPSSAANRAHANGLAIEEGALTTFGPGELAVSRRAGYAQHEPSAAHQRNLRGEERALAHETLGAVDGIDQPHALGVHVRLAGFLAIKAVRRESLAQQVADRLLRAHVGLGDRRLVGLHFDSDITLIEAADDFRGGARRVERGIQFGGWHGARACVRLSGPVN